MAASTRIARQRAGILALLLPRLEDCAAHGFDAVEIDNLDSYTRSAGLLTADDNVALAAQLVRSAHAVGLAIEYADDLRAHFAAACAVPGRPRSMILRDRLLAPAGAAGYVYDRC